MECPMCKTREMLKQIEAIINELPAINTPHYDEVTTELANSVDNAISWFECMCGEIEEGQTS